MADVQRGEALKTDMPFGVERRHGWSTREIVSINAGVNSYIVAINGEGGRTGRTGARQGWDVAAVASRLHRGEGSVVDDEDEGEG